MGPAFEGRQRRVVGVLGRAHQVVGRTRAEIDGGLEVAGEHLDAHPQPDRLHRLVREPPSDHGQDRAAERDEGVALRRGDPVADRRRIRQQGRVRRVDPEGRRELLLRTEAERARDRRDGQERRRALDRRLVRHELRARGAGRQSLTRVRVGVVQVRPVEQDARRRVDETRRVVPDGSEVIGAGHEGAAPAEGSHAAVRDVQTCGAGVPRAGNPGGRRERERRAGDKDSTLHHQGSVAWRTIA